jgi:hypothetical protein
MECKMTDNVIDRLKHKAHPTEYAGVNFRSRLEASWAAFFDLCGWGWEYEPYDLEGWMPDFIIKGKTETVLVEVKPIDWSNCEQSNDAAVLKNPELRKVRDFVSVKEHPEVLILGNGPVGRCAWGNRWLGLLLCAPDYADGAVFEYGREGFDYDIRAEYGSFSHRLSNTYDGDSVCPVDGDEILQNLWRKARNKTQWRRVA